MDQTKEHPLNRIRLACVYCDTDAMDGITPAQLEQCRTDGWEDITEVQTYEQSLETSDDPGYDVTKWYTHVSVCPDCAREQRE